MMTNILPTVNSVVYTGFLNHLGRVLTDGFIYKDNNGYFLDVSKANGKELEIHLRQHLMGSGVDIMDVSNMMEISFDHRYFPNALRDPRGPSLGFRSIRQFTGIPSDQDLYHSRRMILGIPESPHEILWGKSHPFSANLDIMNGINFQKGCYIGQEYIARIRSRGVIRKRIFAVEIKDGNNQEEGLKTVNTDLYNSGIKRGRLLSRIGGLGLALLFVEDVEKHMIYSIGRFNELQIHPRASIDPSTINVSENSVRIANYDDVNQIIRKEISSSS
jgi:tRNA-modifying protein YgfZ